jgi:hypothetical protein
LRPFQAGVAVGGREDFVAVGPQMLHRHSEVGEIVIYEEKGVRAERLGH